MQFYKDSMLYRIINEDVPYRLKSRMPIWKHIEDLLIFNLEIAWKSRYDEFSPMNHDIAPNPDVKLSVNWKRKNWSTINRFCSNVGRCGHCLFKWGIVFDKSCDCGADDQTLAHIISS